MFYLLFSSTPTLLLKPTAYPAERPRHGVQVVITSPRELWPWEAEGVLLQTFCCLVAQESLLPGESLVLPESGVTVFE